MLSNCPNIQLSGGVVPVSEIYGNIATTWSCVTAKINLEKIKIQTIIISLKKKSINLFFILIFEIKTHVIMNTVGNPRAIIIAK